MDDVTSSVDFVMEHLWEQSHGLQDQHKIEVNLEIARRCLENVSEILNKTPRLSVTSSTEPT